ncbi:tryptophan dimethylallyltransferase family protein [Embleya sp. NBC_00896]|uniref:tryptophan dimethylallyltransferase family protein n=1 Tax=Embleya sp. NBC_00896 TaxID=2975961 RepID=UPI00386615C9|nr:hypothetical protein OG928_06345 [Embleya sp. NBC_00896]
MKRLSVPVRGTCASRLENLTRRLDLGERAEEIVAVFRTMTEPWGDARSGELPLSDVSPDGSPVEFAVDFDEADPAVQFAVEPMTPGGTAADASSAARRMMAGLATAYGTSDERWASLADLYLPDDPAGGHVAMYGAEIRRHGPVRFKVWFYPTVEGPDRALDLLGMGLDRLGLQAAWPAVLSHVRRDARRDLPFLLSLDLSASRAARIKIYFRHYDADADYLATLLEKQPGFDPDLTTGFCRLMTGHAEDLTVQPPVTCLTFTIADAREADAATLYVPLWTYAASDEVLRGRVCRLFASHGRSADRYEHVLGEIASRPPADGRGIHNYISWQPGRDRPRVKIYFSPELHDTNPPPRYRLDASDSSCRG